MKSNSSPVTSAMDSSSIDKVIVIGCSLTGYAVIRALADKPVQILALTYSNRDVAQLSRYVTEVVECPDPKHEDQFVACLIQQAERWGGALILETADSPAIALSRNKDLLAPYYRIATPDWPTLSIFIEKEKTYALAKEFNIPHPKSIPLSGREAPDRYAEVLYPCILKPVRSFEFSARFHVKNFQVHNPRQLREKWKLCLEAGQPMILQEIIPGPDVHLYKMQGYVNSQGQLVGKFFYRKLRQNPPHFGIARVGISTAPYADVEDLTEALLARSNYRGYFSNEFKQDPRDGQLKLIENNCRMPRSGMLALASGVNFPWLIYQDLVLDQQTDVTHYQVGTYWIDFWSDLSNSLLRRKEEAISPQEYLRPYFAKHKVFSDSNLRDLKPFLRAGSQNLQSFRHKYLTRRSQILNQSNDAFTRPSAEKG